MSVKLLLEFARRYHADLSDWADAMVAIRASRSVNSVSNDNARLLIAAEDALAA